MQREYFSPAIQFFGSRRWHECIEYPDHARLDCHAMPSERERIIRDDHRIDFDDDEVLPTDLPASAD